MFKDMFDKIKKMNSNEQDKLTNDIKQLFDGFFDKDFQIKFDETFKDFSKNFIYEKTEFTPNPATQNAMKSRQMMKNKDISKIIERDKQYYISGNIVYTLDVEPEYFEIDNETYYKLEVDNDFDFDLPDDYDYEYMELKNKKYIICSEENIIEIGEYYAFPIAKI